MRKGQWEEKFRSRRGKSTGLFRQSVKIDERVTSVARELHGDLYFFMKRKQNKNIYKKKKNLVDSTTPLLESRDKYPHVCRRVKEKT